MQSKMLSTKRCIRSIRSKRDTNDDLPEAGMALPFAFRKHQFNPFNDVSWIEFPRVETTPTTTTVTPAKTSPSTATPTTTSTTTTSTNTPSLDIRYDSYESYETYASGIGGSIVTFIIALLLFCVKKRRERRRNRVEENHGVELIGMGPWSSPPSNFVANEGPKQRRKSVREEMLNAVREMISKNRTRMRKYKVKQNHVVDVDLIELDPPPPAKPAKSSVNEDPKLSIF